MKCSSSGVTVMICLLASVNLCAQTSLRIPQIVCDRPVYDFGTHDQGTNVEHVFTLVNVGALPLVIEQVRACCGSTARLADKIVQPGSGTAVSVSLPLRGRFGPQAKSFYVHSNDPQHPYLQLKLVGSVSQSTTALPPAAAHAIPDAIDFGLVRDDSAVMNLVLIGGPSGVVVRIADITCPARWCRAERKPETGGTGVEIMIRLVPPLPLGHISTQVTVTTDRVGYPQLVIPIVACVFSDCQIVPSEIVLVESDSGSRPVTRCVALRSRSGKPFKICQVAFPDPAITVQIEPMGAVGYRFMLGNVRPIASLNGKEMTVATDYGTNKTFVIPFRVIPASLLPAAIPAVPRGQASSRS